MCDNVDDGVLIDRLSSYRLISKPLLSTEQLTVGWQRFPHPSY